MHKLIKFLTLVLVAILFESNSGGRNSPTTGAPFEEDPGACAQCHGGGSFTPTLNVTMKNVNNDVVTTYQPGQLYTIEFKVGVSAGSPKEYGFQAVIVDDQNEQAGEFTALGEKVRRLTLQNRIFLTHISPKADGLFTAKWLAPGDQQSATIYFAGLATNNNNSTSGDKGTFSSFVFQKAATSSTSEDSFTNSYLKTNMVKDYLEFTKPVSEAKIFNINGGFEKSVTSLNNNVSDLASGMYILTFISNGNQIAKKFLIID